MKKLTMNDHIKSGAFANKTVEEVTKIKGAIFSMIKEGYEFDDEVLKAARIRKIIRDEKIDFVVFSNSAVLCLDYFLPALGRFAPYFERR